MPALHVACASLFPAVVAQPRTNTIMWRAACAVWPHNTQLTAHSSQQHAQSTLHHTNPDHTREIMSLALSLHTCRHNTNTCPTQHKHTCAVVTNGNAASASLSLSIHSPFHSYHASLHLLDFVSCTRDVVHSVSQPSSTRGWLPPTLFLIESRAYVRRPLVCCPFSSPYTTRQALSARKTPTTDVFCTSCCHCASRTLLLSKPFRSPSSLACSATNDEFHAAPQPLHMHTHRRVPDRSYDRYHE